MIFTSNSITRDYVYNPEVAEKLFVNFIEINMDNLIMRKPYQECFLEDCSFVTWVQKNLDKTLKTTILDGYNNKVSPMWSYYIFSGKEFLDDELRLLLCRNMSISQSFSRFVLSKVKELSEKEKEILVVK